MTMNRTPTNSSIFQMRHADVKWPTLRGAYITDTSVARLGYMAKYVGRSIIFLDGMYNTNLNKWTDKGPEERAVFFEWIVRGPKTGDNIFFLCWAGNYHNGSIFHCAPQYPQSNTWIEQLGTEWLDMQAARIYVRVVQCLYEVGTETDSEVAAFVANYYEELRKRQLAKWGYSA